VFVLLLLVNLGIALAATLLVILAFRGPIAGILSRIVEDQVAAAWRRYLVFALFVVGVSSGVSPWNLERYSKAGATPMGGEPPTFLPLDPDLWALELYRTAMSSLRGLTWALFLFFAIGLVLSALLRMSEARSGRPGIGRSASDPARGRAPLSSRSAIGNRGGRERPLEPRRQPAESRRRESGRRGEGRISGEGRGGEGRGESRGGEGRGGEGRGGEGRRGDIRGRDEPRGSGEGEGRGERRDFERRMLRPLGEEARPAPAGDLGRTRPGHGILGQPAPGRRP
jgi:hypothetical protein